MTAEHRVCWTTGDPLSELYQTDILTWSKRQAELLRRRAAGALDKEAELDWSNIAEEIEDVGLTDCWNSPRPTPPPEPACDGASPLWSVPIPEFLAVARSGARSGQPASARGTAGEIASDDA